MGEDGRLGPRQAGPDGWGRPDLPPMPSVPPQRPGTSAGKPGYGYGPEYGAVSDPGAPFVAWMRESRPDAAPGVWRHGHVPRPPEEPDRLSDRQLLGAAALSVLIGLIAWSFYRNGLFLFGMLDAPLDWFTPDSWWEGEGGRRDKRAATSARDLYDTLVFAAIALVCGRAGGWPELYRRFAVDRGPVMQAALTGVAAFVVVLLLLTGAVPLLRGLFGVPLSWTNGWNTYLAVAFVYTLYGIVLAAVLYPLSRLGKWREVLTAKWRGEALEGDAAEEADPEDAEAEDPVAWPELRAAGLVAEAEALGGAAGSGAMNDVDLARIGRAWESVRARPERLKAFADSVRYDGPAACPHPSGLRDIGRRAYRHDLVTGQVRIGAAPDDKRNPHAYRGGGIALEAALLGTGLLAVGPAGNVVSDRVTGPVAELLCLQALAGRAAVVAVGAAGTQLGDDDSYDVVIRIADPSSPHDLDLYGGTADPDEAAALLAEALLGGDEADWPHGRPAVTALGQLIGAYQSAYGRFPGVAELRALLDGDRAALAALRRDCAAVAAGSDRPADRPADGGAHPDGYPDAYAADRAAAALRELDARERQLSRPGDVGALLAGRLAVLDRPVFARFFDTRGRGRQFSMRALEHPMRVRIELPERTHAEASRVLARLLLAQFTAAAPARADRSLFAALVLDDAARTASPESVRAIGRLRAAHAGVVLGLRGLDDVAEAVRGPLLAAVGCRMALTGVSTWDGRHFAEAWGAEWVEAEDVTHVPDASGGLIRRLLRWIRQVFTGTKAMSRSVTVRTVERERWSASELANTLPPGHAVLSVTTVSGERTPPVLVDLHH